MVSHECKVSVPNFKYLFEEAVVSLEKMLAAFNY